MTLWNPSGPHLEMRGILTLSLYRAHLGHFRGGGGGKMHHICALLFEGGTPHKIMSMIIFIDVWSHCNLWCHLYWADIPETSPSIIIYTKPHPINSIYWPSTGAELPRAPWTRWTPSAPTCPCPACWSWWRMSPCWRAGRSHWCQRRWGSAATHQGQSDHPGGRGGGWWLNCDECVTIYNLSISPPFF